MEGGDAIPGLGWGRGRPEGGVHREGVAAMAGTGGGARVSGEGRGLSGCPAAWEGRLGGGQHT